MEDPRRDVLQAACPREGAGASQAGEGVKDRYAMPAVAREAVAPNQGLVLLRVRACQSKMMAMRLLIQTMTNPGQPMPQNSSPK